MISIEEFKKNPKEYYFRIKKGFFGFPLGLSFDYINKNLFENFGNLNIKTDPSTGNIESVEFHPNGFIIGHCLNADIECKKLSRYIYSVFRLSDLDKSWKELWDDGYMSLDLPDFFANYESLKNFIKDLPLVLEEKKRRALTGLETVYFILTKTIDLVLKTRIRDPKELLMDIHMSNNNETSLIQSSLDLDEMTDIIYEHLLQKPRNCNFKDISNYLNVRSKEQFYALASERTIELLTDRSKYEFLERLLNGRDLNELSVGELVLFSAFFSRYIIEEYQDLDTAVKNVFQRNLTKAMSGKCTGYSALMAHYLNLYLKPVMEDKFKNWRFCVESDIIGISYARAYFKAMRINPDYSIDVYFLDPTRLATGNLEEIKTPDEIIKKIDALNLPLQMDRSAKDLLYKEK